MTKMWADGHQDKEERNLRYRITVIERYSLVGPFCTHRFLAEYIGYSFSPCPSIILKRLVGIPKWCVNEYKGTYLPTEVGTPKKARKTESSTFMSLRPP